MEELPEPFPAERLRGSVLPHRSDPGLWAELAIQYDTAVTKMYNAANCEALGITVPDGYQPIE